MYLLQSCTPQYRKKSCTASWSFSTTLSKEVPKNINDAQFSHNLCLSHIHACLQHSCMFAGSVLSTYWPLNIVHFFSSSPSLPTLLKFRTYIHTYFSRQKQAHGNACVVCYHIYTLLTPSLTLCTASALFQRPLECPKDFVSPIILSLPFPSFSAYEHSPQNTNEFRWKGWNWSCKIKVQETYYLGKWGKYFCLRYTITIPCYLRDHIFLREN